MKNLRAMLTSLVFLFLIGAFFFLNRIIIPPEISLSERRPLATMPELSLASISSGTFMDDFETFAADSFAFREKWRGLRALTIFDVYLQTDKEGLYRGQSGIGKFERMRPDQYRLVAAKIKLLAGRMEGVNLYYSVVPDKSIYAGFFLPGYDQGRAEEILKEELSDIQYIEIATSLKGADYYRTDLHWDQSKILPVVSALGNAMNFRSPQELARSTRGEFKGVYAGHYALPIDPDTMTYFTEGDAPKYSATYLNTAGQTEAGPIYDNAAFFSVDPYNFFLQGPRPLIWLKREGVESPKRSLYFFRDSFGSSLAPLIAFGGSYDQVVLIDMRYIDSRALPQFVEFEEGADVLFLYSSQILNQSSVLRVQ